jgi:hypothetical protein
MKHKLLNWEEYQLLRRNIAQYMNTLLKHEPEKDLTNDEINNINSDIYDYLNIQNIMGMYTSKNLSHMFYRKIELVGESINFSKLYLLDPSTMPKKNIIDSIFSWLENGGIYSGNKYVASTMIGLSKEDIEEYKPLLDERISKLEYGIDYTGYLDEM